MKKSLKVLTCNKMNWINTKKEPENVIELQWKKQEIR